MPRMLLRICSSAIFVLAIFSAYLVEAEAVTGFFVRNGDAVSDTFSLEVSESTSKRSLGLMYRRELKENEGMLFLYPEEAQRSFWMKNTYIPLDIIFLDKTLKVQGAVQSAQPRTTVPQMLANTKSMYVLEIPGGRYKSLGIIPGDILTIQGALPEAQPGP